MLIFFLISAQEALSFPATLSVESISPRLKGNNRRAFTGTSNKALRDVIYSRTGR